jgi:outer membrane protein
MAGLSVLGIPAALAQTQIDQMPAIAGATSGLRIDQGGNPYASKHVSPIPFENSSRISSLMRGGLLYLSLEDAIALALENNLDIELQRFAPGIADTELLRARGGGQLRGISLISTQPPAGVGGPASPLLNSATPGFTVATSLAATITSTAVLASPQNDLSIAAGALSPGSPIPLYDPVLTSGLSWQHNTAPQPTSFITGVDNLVTRMTAGNANLVQGFSPGSQIAAAFDSTSQTSNSIRSALNPYNSSSFGLTFTQPLLRGFGIKVNRRYIRIAQNEQKLSDLLFRQQVMDTVSGVTRLYYDLVSLLADVRVKQETLAVAQKLYDDDKQQVDQGTLAPIELVHAQALVAASRQDLANSEGLAKEQALILKTVITRRGTADPAIRDARLVPTTPIPGPGAEQVQPVQDLLASAFQNRPDYLAANLQLANSQIGLEGSRNQLLPEVDFIAAAQNSGLAGQPNPLLPPGQGAASPASIGGIGTALDQILRRNYPTYSVGVQLTLPLRNRQAQADYVRDLLQVRQTQVQRQRLENQVRLDVEAALIDLERTRAAYQAAVETRVYQEKSFKAEQEMFAVGLASTFLIIQYQGQLAQARSTEVAALGAYAKARVALEYAIGKILEDDNISIGEARRGQVSQPPAPLPAVEAAPKP